MWYNRGMEQAILQFFENLRCPALTYFFGTFSFFGEAVIISAIILLLYWLIGGSAGEQLLFTAVTSASVNSFIKATVMRPRPYAAGVVERLDVDTPFFTTRNLGDNLSFPSGHAQATTSAVLTGAMKKQRVWIWICAVLFILLVCCSRLYFGVHYPTDVLTGVLLGTAIAVFWHLIFRHAYDKRYFILMGIAVVMLLLLPLALEKDNVHMTALVSGGAFFLPLTSLLNYKPPKKFWRRLIRIPVGLICTGAVFAATRLFPDGYGFSLLSWFLLAGAATFLSTLFFKIAKI